MASDATKAAAAPGKSEAVDEYESDPDEVNRSLVMRRREASDDEEEEEERESERRRVHIHSDDESDGQGYEDEEEEEHEGELEEEEDVYDDGDEEEERHNGEVKVEGMEGADGIKSTGGAVGSSAGNNANGNDVQEEEKEKIEPFAVPTAGAFYMHDDRFRDNVGGGRHRY